MANRVNNQALSVLEETIRLLQGPVSLSAILAALPEPSAPRTLQYRLNHLVLSGRLVREGSGRWARYSLPQPGGSITENDPASGLPLSQAAQEILAAVRRPLITRLPVGYSADFLAAYRPNTTFYLSEAERARLASAGQIGAVNQPAGTYARQILSRLLIDLAWNSSRLEGNTYSLLDTRRLIEFGHEAEGRAHLEAQMILNHKDAIEFLVGSAVDTGFNRYTILNLHALLANNLLPDSSAAGRLRHIAVGIEGSVFHPLEVPQLIAEHFDRMLATATAIADPYEQAFFIMVHLPYLQPFDDVNKRVSRLAANIPLIRANLAPLSFTDVPQQVYTQAVLGIYELNRIDLLKDLFVWAYERSAARYGAVRQSLGEPDPFRLRYRDELREIIAALVRQKTPRHAVADFIRNWAEARIVPVDRDRFAESVEMEITGLHEGNFARHQIRPSEFMAWQEIWKNT